MNMKATKQKVKKEKLNFLDIFLEQEVYPVVRNGGMKCL